MSLRAKRALRLCTSFAILIAICACGTRRSEESSAPAEVAPAVPPEPTTVTLPDAVMPLTEGGEVSPRDPGTSTVMARFPNGQFETLRSRVTTWMPANGWTLVPGSEVDAERTARNLEEMGLREAAALARRNPSFGASYQRAGHTVAVTIDSLDGTLQMSINWF